MYWIFPILLLPLHGVRLDIAGCGDNANIKIHFVRFLIQMSLILARSDTFCVIYHTNILYSNDFIHILYDHSYKSTLFASKSIFLYYFSYKTARFACLSAHRDLSACPCSLPAWTLRLVRPMSLLSRPPSSDAARKSSLAYSTS